MVWYVYIFWNDDHNKFFPIWATREAQYTCDRQAQICNPDHLTPDPPPHHWGRGSLSEHPLPRPLLWEELFVERLVLWPSPTFPTLSFWKIPPSALLKYCLPALGTQRLKYQPLPSCLIYISKGLFRIWLGFKINLRAWLGFIFLPSSVVPTLAAH